MADPTTVYRISAVVEGADKVQALKQTINLLANTTSPAADAVEELRRRALELGTATSASTKDIKTAATSLRELQNVVNASSSDFLDLAKDASTLEGRLAAVSSTTKVLRDATAPTTTEIKRLRDAAIQLGTAADASEKELQQSISTLRGLKSQTAITSQGYVALARDIELVEGRLKAATTSFRSFGAAQASASRNPFQVSGARRNLGDANQFAGQAVGPQPMDYGKVDAALQNYIDSLDQVGATYGQVRRDNVKAAVAFNQVEIDAQEEFNKRQADLWEISRQDGDKKWKKDLEAADRRQKIAKDANANMADANLQMERILRESQERVAKIEIDGAARLDAIRDKQMKDELKSNEAFEDERLKKYDQQMRNRAQRKQRLVNFGQSAGAIAASGVFGGPEGLAGAAIGSAFGPAGALAGGAIGAQAGMFRQQIGGTADYAASIQRLQIALKGVTATEAEYQRSLAITAAITRDLNVPQLEATQGFTRLAASVIGAGGKVADAEVVFRNVTSAIKATGGSSEDVQGALLAVAQVFSKGKVSAEELSGQLGERLPGAVTMFAKATGRSLPQLKKDLEQGVVGLSDFMKFVTSDQGLNQFPTKAEEIAKSSADAGARLTRTWNDVRLAIGTALQPIGAQIQDSLGKLLTELTPALIATAKTLATAIKFVVDNFGAIGNITKFLVVIGGVNLATKLLPTILGSASQALALLGATFGKTTAQAIVAEKRLATLKTTLLSIAKIGIITVAVDVAVSGISNLINAQREIGKLKGQAALDPVTLLGGASTSRESVEVQQKRALKTIQEIQEERRRLRQDVKGSVARTLLGPVARVFGQQSTVDVGDRLRVLKAREEEARRKLQVSAADFKSQNASAANALTDFTTPATEGAGGADKEADKAKKAADDLAAKQQRLQEELNAAYMRGEDAKHQAAIELIRLRYEYEQQLNNKQRENWVKSFTGAARSAAGLIAGFQNEINGLDSKILDANQKVEEARFAETKAKQQAVVTSQGLSATTVEPNQGIVARILATAQRNLGLFAGSAERCADAMRVLFKETNIGVGVTKKAWDGLESGARLASSFFGSDVGQRITKKEDLRAGDLVGFDQTYGNWKKGVQTHVGMYAGDGMMFDHSSRKGLTKRPVDTFAGKFLYGVRPYAYGSGEVAQGKGKPQQQLRSVNAEGLAAAESVQFQAANEALKLTEEQIKEIKAAYGEGFVKDFSQDVKDQTASLTQSNNALSVRNRLTLEGQRSEYIDGEIEKIKAQDEYKQKLEASQSALQYLESEEAKKKFTDETRTFLIQQQTKAVEEYERQFPSLIAAINQGTQSQIAFNDALEKQQKIKDFAGNIASTISGGIGEAFDKLLEGTADWKKALQDISTNVLRDIAKQLINMVVVEPIKKSIASMLEGIMGGGKQAIPQLAAAGVPQLASAVSITPQATYNTTPQTSTSSMLDFNAASSGLNAWSSQLPNLAQSTTQLTDATQATSQAILNTAQGATQASTGFAGLSQNLGKAMAALAGIGVGAAGAQQIGQGGASNFLGGLGKMFVGAGSLLGGFGGFGGGGAGLAGAAQNVNFNPLAFALPQLAEKGATFYGGTARFAKGGIVSRPTMFKFADGGQLQNGLMGEAGPEAIIPLRRGSNGRLGVEANGLRDAMGPGPGSATAAAPMLNMSFETTKFGDTEYVSRDQLESAMAATRRQASRDGARRGMSMTLDKLQQSPGTRSRVGIR